VKRSADMNIKQGKCVIQTAEDFFAWTESITSSSVKYFYVSNEDVENCSQYIQSVSSQLLSVPGTIKVHAVSPVCSEFIMIRNMSCYCQGCNNNLSDRACDGWSKCRISKRHRKRQQQNLIHQCQPFANLFSAFEESFSFP
jgi:hypothetical protein